jgi:hypothetical protein
MERVRGVVTVRSDGRLLEQVEHHQRRDALAVRREFVHRPAAVRRRQRHDPFGVVALEIRGRERAAVLPGTAGDAVGDAAAVERVSSFERQRAIGGGEVRVSEHFAG